MKAYRLKHTPTGLFYKPALGTSNLSFKGKLFFFRRPNINNALLLTIKIDSWRKKPTKFEKLVLEYFKPEVVLYGKFLAKTKKEDWELIELNLEEK